MTIYKLPKNINHKEYLQKINIDTNAIKILENKMSLHLLYIKDLNVIGANILKQDALSIGADVATPKDTITHKKEKVDVILIASNKHLKILSKKEYIQPFGLKEVAIKLKDFLYTKTFPPKIMSIINANDDSFFQNSRFIGNKAIEKIEQMIEQNADIIDIGAISSRPFSKEVSQEEELNRLKPIIDSIYKNKLYDKIIFSVDTYRSSIASYALERGFKIINDITSMSDKNMAKTISKYNDASIVLMHMQGSPKNMQVNPQYTDVVQEVDNFFYNKIQIAKQENIQNIILDIGIGFGKRLEDNINLIKHINHFQHFGYEILIGASRKSMINDIIQTDIQDRLSGSLCIHQKALENGASIIRTHDVKEHIQMLKVFEYIK
jgi:dihydropteroate synthase